MKLLRRIEAAYLAFRSPLLMIDDSSLYGVIKYDGIALIKPVHIGEHLTYEVHALTPEDQHSIMRFLNI